MGSNASAQQAVNAETLDLGTAAYEDIGTSGATLGFLNTANTVSGVETHTANIIFPADERLYLRGLAGAYITAGGATGQVAEFYPNGAITARKTEAVFNAADVMTQAYPTAGSGGVTETVTGNLYLSTTNSGDVRVTPLRTQVADFTSTGTRIATAGTGGTRIAKLRTELVTMAAGTTGAIADTALTAGSIITLTYGFAPVGILYYVKNVGVGFTINSTSALDAGEISWQRTVV